jgi:hypothetical protein
MPMPENSGGRSVLVIGSKRIASGVSGMLDTLERSRSQKFKRGGMVQRNRKPSKLTGAILRELLDYAADTGSCGGSDLVHRSKDNLFDHFVCDREQF